MTDAIDDVLKNLVCIVAFPKANDRTTNAVRPDFRGLDDPYLLIGIMVHEQRAAVVQAIKPYGRRFMLENFIAEETLDGRFAGKSEFDRAFRDIDCRCRNLKFTILDFPDFLFSIFFRWHDSPMKKPALSGFD